MPGRVDFAEHFELADGRRGESEVRGVMIAIQQSQGFAVGVDGEEDVGCRERACRGEETVGACRQCAELPFDAFPGGEALRGDAEGPVVGDGCLDVVEGGRTVGQQVQAFGNRIGSTPSLKVVPMAM